MKRFIIFLALLFFSLKLFTQTPAEVIVQTDSLLNNEQYATTLDSLGLLSRNIGDYVLAEKYFLEAKNIYEKVLGKEYPSYSITLNNLGGLYDDIGDYFSAEKYFLEAKTILEEVLGKEHPWYASTLNNLGGLYEDIGNYSSAEKYFLEAKTINEKVLGKENPNYARTLNNLGSLYEKIGDYVLAERYSLEAKIINEKVLGKEDPNYSKILNSLGVLYCEMGDYVSAEKYYLEAKAVHEKVSGKDNPYYAIILDNLGGLYEYMGDYASAEKYQLEAKTINENVLGKEHPYYARSLNSLGVLYTSMGDYVSAERYYLEAKAINEKVLGKGHPTYSTTLNNLGGLYSDMKDYASAEKCYLEVKTNLEKVLGKEHPWYASTLNNLGGLYEDIGDYVSAEKYYLEAITINEKVLGKEHPNYARTLNNLGSLYEKMGDYASAEKYYLEAITINGKVLGKEHPNYTRTLNNLGSCYEKIGDFVSAEKYYLEQIQINLQQISHNFSFMSENQRNAFWEKNQSNFEMFYSFSFWYPQPTVISQAYNNTLVTKGLLLRTTNGIRDAIYSSGNTRLIKQFEELGNLRQEIDKLQQKTDYSKDYVESLLSRADSLDKAVTLASSAYRDMKADIAMTWQDVQKQLKSNEVAIEFVSFLLFDKQWTDSTMYAALVLRKDFKSPEYVPLFEQSQLSELLNNENPDITKRIQKLYNGGSSIYNGQKLYNLIWQPLEKYLNGVETVYYSPAGLLNRISFSVIPVDTLCLTDKYNLHLVSSTREIINEKKETLLPITQVVEYGGIQYDIQDTMLLISSAEKYKKPETEMLASRSLPNDRTRSSGWSYLSGTEKEVDDIAKLLQQDKIPNIKYVGVEANEESFKALSGNSPELLHIATHGFFLEDEKQIRETGFMQIMNSQNRTYINPLLRSGLLFAGANRAWTNQDVILGIEDGILTAEEISNLDLSKTKLAVLSACETGLGEVNNSEGVFGLQRAFKLAGVKTLVMSLWKVDDTATSQFMLTFYQNLLAGKGKLESFKLAQKQIREQYKNPYYWAAFVMMD